MVHGSTSVRSQVSQRLPGGFAAGKVAQHAAALFPASLAFDLVGGRAVLGHAAYSDRNQVGVRELRCWATSNWLVPQHSSRNGCYANRIFGCQCNAPSIFESGTGIAT